MEPDYVFNEFVASLEAQCASDEEKHREFHFLMLSSSFHLNPIQAPIGQEEYSTNRGGGHLNTGSRSFLDLRIKRQISKADGPL